MEQPQTKEQVFDELLQYLPPELEQLAYDFKVFVRSRKIKTVPELLRVVLLYCGLDLSLREVAGHLTLLDERITDEAVRKRLKACQPWVKALLFEMLPHRSPTHLPKGLRFCAFDGSSIQAPGATGTDYRLHIGMDLVTLEFTHLLVTDKYTGESLTNYPLNPGDVAVVDRGLCHASGILEKQQQGAEVVARYNQYCMPLDKEDGTPFDLISELKQFDIEHKKSLSVKSFPVSRLVAGKDQKESEEKSGHLMVMRTGRRGGKLISYALNKAF